MEQFDVARIREDFPILKREVNGKPLVYLDNAATSQKPRAMIERMSELYSREYARVEEGHTLSREATKVFEGTRAKVAKLINAAEPREIIFCRGATEALNLVARSFEQDSLQEGDEVLVTEAEHHSNIVPWLLACRMVGARLRAAPITPNGDLDLPAFERMLNDKVRVVGVTQMSNVTGAIWPVKLITAMAHARGIPVLVDGAQAVPHMPVDVREIGCDFYAGSGHKMGGPSSVGFLYGRAEMLERMPASDGGSTMAESVSFDEIIPKPIPHKYEAGEPAFGEVEAWGAALDYWNEIGLERIAAYEEALTAYAAGLLSDIKNVRVLGSPAERLSIISFVIDGKSPKDVEKALDAEGIAVRAGKLAAQPLLKAMGTDEAVRASFMFYNTQAEADALASALETIAR
ncbi:MAG: aminotransferase class V-fold PLP-dependent enzyme [Blastocatellia bacterium]